MKLPLLLVTCLLLAALLFVNLALLPAQVTISLIFTVPGNGVLPSTQSFIPAGVPNIGPFDGAIIFRRPDPPPSQACRFNAVVSNPEIIELVIQQAFLEPDNGIGGTGAQWQAAILYRGKRAGSAVISVTWDEGACGIQSRAAGARAASATFPVTVQVDPKDPQKSGPNTQQGKSANPVGTFTGDLEDAPRSPDLDLGGPFPLRFIRHYSSGLDVSLPGSGGGQGRNWMHNFDARASVVGSAANVTLFRGQDVAFSRQADGSWKRSSAETVDYQFSSSGTSYRFADPGDGLIYTFSNFGRLTEIEDANGNKQTITRGGGSSGPDQVSDGLGRLLKFTYAGGTLSKVEDQTGRAVTFTYAGGNLTAFTNAAGKTVTYAYSSPGKLTTATLPAGNKPYTQQYEASGRVSRQTDSRGNSTTFSYGPAAGAATVTGPLNAVVRDTHDAEGNLVRRTDELGRDTVYVYDASKRLTRITDRRGNVTQTAYHEPFGFPAAITDAAGNVTKFTYTAQARSGFTFYNLTRIEYPDGVSESFVYDARGNVTQFTDRAGKNWTSTYNSRGQVLTTSNPVGGVTTSTYNDNGTTASLRLPSGDLTTFEYDAQLRLIRVAHPGGATRQFAYNGLNQILTETDERGKVTTYAYNENNLPRSISNALSQATQFAYDGDERIATATDALSHALTLSYDQAGRLQSLTDAAGVVESYGYDPAGRRTTVSDSAGKRLEFGYDEEGAINAITDGLARKWTVAHDKLGRPIKAVDPLRRAIDLTYDPLGRIASVANAAGERAELQYDPRGLLSKAILPANVTASYLHNDLGLVTTVTDPNQGNWTAGYDTLGRRTSDTDPLGRASAYTYDNRQFVNRVSLPGGGSVNITHDAAGNQTRRQYSDGTDLQFTYDDAGRLTGGTGLALGYNAAGELTASNGLQIARDNAGRIGAITYAAGKTVTYTYNAQGLLSRITDWVGGSTDFTYDAALQISSTRRPNNVVSTLTYAGDGRLSKSAWSGASVNASIEWTRDDAGRVIGENRTIPGAVSFTAATQQFTYDAAHQRTGAGHDSLGRLTADGGRAYSWDLASRLKGFTDPGFNTLYQYDALGQLTAAGRTFAWNYAFPLPSIAIEREGPTDARYYIYTPNGQLVESIDSTNQRRYYHNDERGNVVFLTNDAGAITDTYAYAPYGEIIARTGSSDNSFTFLGGYGVMQMGSSGLFYMRARFYDSATARFLSKDPVSHLDPLQLNPYPYAAENPVRYVDPAGTSKIEAGAAPVPQPARVIRAARPNLGITRPVINYNPSPPPPAPPSPVPGTAPVGRNIGLAPQFEGYNTAYQEGILGAVILGAQGGHDLFGVFSIVKQESEALVGPPPQPVNVRHGLIQFQPPAPPSTSAVSYSVNQLMVI